MQYDLKLDKGENSVTQRNATFLKTMELMQLAPEYRAALLPYLVRLTDHPDKEEMLQAVGVQSQINNTKEAIELVGGASGSPAKGGGTNIQQQISE
jgi:hypothetical protein